MRATSQKENQSLETSNIFLSLIVPVYNVEDYIEDCLDSIVPQLSDDIEVICINDGSTDNSLEVLSGYRKVKNITIVSTNNGGLAAARNIGIRKAKGEYLVFIDGDDFIFPTYLSDIKKIILKQNHDIDILFVGLRRFDSTNMKLLPEEPYYLASSYGVEGRLPPKVIYKRLFEKFGAPFKVIKRSFFIEENLFYQEGTLFEDVIPHVKAILTAKQIYISNLAPYCYRFNRIGSIMNAPYDFNKVINIFKYLIGVRSILKRKNKYQLLRDEYRSFYIQQVEFHKKKITSKTLKVFFSISSRLLLKIYY